MQRRASVQAELDAAMQVPRTNRRGYEDRHATIQQILKKAGDQRSFVQMDGRAFMLTQWRCLI